MSLRIGIDLDGTLADLSALYHEYEDAIFGSQPGHELEDVDETAEPPEDDSAKAARADTRRQEQVWRALRHTPDFWTLLKPIEDGVIRQLYETMLTRDWEIFFITQRPGTAGASVQLQTQRWLVQQGFEMPSVLTLVGSRGRAAHALDLDFLVDDLPKNCVDVVSDSRCRPILLLRKPNPQAELAARRMNIGVVRSVAEAIDVLKQPQGVPQETLLDGVLRRLGISR